MSIQPNITLDRLGLAPPKFKPGFFIDYRKGDVGELRLLLRKMAMDSQFDSNTDGAVPRIVSAQMGTSVSTIIKKRRDILRRLISCMTLGIDLSRLYADVVMISHTNDIVQKKMIYLYLSTYSKENPDLTVLTINNFLKDVSSLDPTVRSLALRNICAFGTRLSNEYAKSVVLKKLFDPSDIVKRSAIIGGLKIYKSEYEKNKEDNSACDSLRIVQYKSDILSRLKSAFKSSNMNVMFDAMCAFAEMVDFEQRIKLTKSTIIYFINNLKKMNEWVQCAILQILSTYVPADDELFDLMNLLDEKLNHQSSAVFLATAKCFITWTRHDRMLQFEVIKRLQNPMISLVSSSCHEILYILLLNILLLIVNVPKVDCDFVGVGNENTEARHTFKIPFSEHYEVFFCRFDDPVYVKRVKLDILAAISCEEHCLEIIHELNEYVSDTNHGIATKSIRCLGTIAQRHPSHLELIISLISAILASGMSHLIGAVLFVITGLLRVYPQHRKQLLDIVEDSRDFMADPIAISHYIWILGEYGSELDHTPYTLKMFIDDYAQPDFVINELLCASMKVFFKRPPEMYKALSRIIKRILSDCQNPDLLNTARFYYSLLLIDVETAKDIFIGDDDNVKNSLSLDLMGRREFVVPNSQWHELFNSIQLVDKYQPNSNPLFFPFEYGDVTQDIFSSNVEDDDDVGIRCPEVMNIPSGTAESCSPNTTWEADLPSHDIADSKKCSEFVELLNKSLDHLNLVHPNTIFSEEFQKRWFEAEKECTSKTEFVCESPEIDTEQLEELLSKVHIITLASGNSEQATKFYQYSECFDGAVYYIEIIFEHVDAKCCIKVAVKTQDENSQESKLQSFADSLCHCLQNWIFIQ